jgi:hypothetical protein
LNLLSSKPFQKSYVKNSVDLPHFEKHNAVFVHEASPEWQRRETWRSVRVGK